LDAGWSAGFEPRQCAKVSGHWYPPNVPNGQCKGKCHRNMKEVCLHCDVNSLGSKGANIRARLRNQGPPTLKLSLVQNLSGFVPPDSQGRSPKFFLHIQCSCVLNAHYSAILPAEHSQLQYISLHHNFPLTPNSLSSPPLSMIYPKATGLKPPPPSSRIGNGGFLRFCVKKTGWRVEGS